MQEKTVLEKYYYLIAEAYFNEHSKFRKLLLTGGTDIIQMLDYINEKEISMVLIMMEQNQ